MIMCVDQSRKHQVTLQIYAVSTSRERTSFVFSHDCIDAATANAHLRSNAIGRSQRKPGPAYAIGYPQPIFVNYCIPVRLFFALCLEYVNGRALADGIEVFTFSAFLEDNALFCSESQFQLNGQF